MNNILKELEQEILKLLAQDNKIVIVNDTVINTYDTINELLGRYSELYRALNWQ